MQAGLAGQLPGLGFSLLPEAGKGLFPELVFRVLRRFGSACQEGKGAI